MRPFDPFIIDANTRHLYHFHNRTMSDRGSAGDDLSGVGGPTLDDDGLHCANGSKYATTGAVVDWSGMANITMQAWARFTGAQDHAVWEYPFSWFLDGNNYFRAGLLPTSGTYPLLYVAAKFAGSLVYSAKELSADQWAVITAAGGCHWGATAYLNGAASAVKLYLNNTLSLTKGGTLGAIAGGNGKLNAGSYASNAAYAWTGWVDNLKVSDELLTSFPLVRFTEGRRGVARGPGLDAIAGVAA